MEIYKIENLTFKYPTAVKPALDNISLSINPGEFITVCGMSGSGKTTLLRLLKPVMAPHGERSGNILYFGTESLDLRTQSRKIGFVTQNPDAQIVTDKVWHELAFGLEGLGMKTEEIRIRVAEISSFFGIKDWFHKDVSELSGGQKQLLNLASVIVMQPDVLILDEPLSSLDPIATENFVNALSKANRELGTTIIMSEHRLEDVFPFSDRVIVLDDGKIIADDKPSAVGKAVVGKELFNSFPAAMQIFETVGCSFCPVTVKEGKTHINELPLNKNIKFEKNDISLNKENAVKISSIRFRYEKDLPDVICGLSAEIKKGTHYAIVGGNGVGKSTLLSLIAGIRKPYSGKTEVFGKVSMLPQNPKLLFSKKTVLEELEEMSSDKASTDNVIKLCGLEKLLYSHPYDISGGEQQRAALAKVLLSNPDILLLDEPTRCIDIRFKKMLSDLINTLKQNGVTIITVSHDIDFCAESADMCAMLFDGTLLSEAEPREFFSDKSFYTTAANRMVRDIIPTAITVKDVIKACGIECKHQEPPEKEYIRPEKQVIKTVPKKIKLVPGIIFSILCVISAILSMKMPLVIFQVISLIFAVCACICFTPKQKYEFKHIKKGKLSKRTIVSILLLLISVPVTLFVGMKYFGERQYFITAMMMVIEAILPFVLIFEDRKPQARELVIISILCAIAVSGRIVFSAFPQFKPSLAVVIISGICFGGETGFLVGAVTGFVSNFFFGQGLWTPWQMLAYGLSGFLAGILVRFGLIGKSKLSVSIFGGFSAIIIYGSIVNISSVFLWQPSPTAEMLVSSVVMGFPFDIIHAVSTMFFLWFAAEPMVDKLERIKMKYGLL